ncbi:MAG: sulfite exporter TauE/SafE family protein [Melioribacteraceae bacterium]|nr:sulfite exporter TauE/SafE family protein [Melioribacteraceae bacterium]MCF8355274.1 sulfite exporter TauE/SafE family protein [Melioribacteraceae bacterium]MCF8394173.1 sulfite exporter TauE/SafE family protein [Melioribacteraceae bacterium]
MFLLLGVITGIVAGLLGLGGGIVLMPSLLIIFPHIYNLNPELTFFIAVATTLLAGSFAAGSSAINHLHIRNIDFKKSVLLSIGPVFTGLLGPEIYVSFHPAIIKPILAVIFLFVSVKLFLEKDSSNIAKIKLNDIWLVFIGIVVGAISVMSGIGGGIFFIPVLLYLYSFDMKLAVGTATFPITITMIFSTIGYAIASVGTEFDFHNIGYINLDAGIVLGVGAVFGSYLGVKLIVHTPVAIIRKIFSIFLLIFIYKLLA